MPKDSDQGRVSEIEQRAEKLLRRGYHVIDLAAADTIRDLLAELSVLRHQQEQLQQERDEAIKDAQYHFDCRPNRRQAEKAMADAKALNDWRADVTAAVIGACGLEGGLHYEDVVSRVRELGARLRIAEAASRRCEEENGAHCPEDRSCGETITALRAAEATGEAAVSQVAALKKENDELKERLARVDGERRAAGPTGSTAASNEVTP